jgi:enoyl-CoA hydratase
VRALLIDKTGDPRWSPARPQDVTDAMVDAYFQPLPADQAWTPLPPKEVM